LTESAWLGDQHLIADARTWFLREAGRRDDEKKGEKKWKKEPTEISWISSKPALETFTFISQR